MGLGQDVNVLGHDVEAFGHDVKVLGHDVKVFIGDHQGDWKFKVL